MTDLEIEQLAEKALYGFPMHPVQNQMPILKRLLGQVEEALRYVRDHSGPTMR